MRLFKYLVASAFLFGMVACEEDGAPPPQQPGDDPAPPPAEPQQSIMDMSLSSTVDVMTMTDAVREFATERIQALD